MVWNVAVIIEDLPNNIRNTRSAKIEYYAHTKMFIFKKLLKINIKFLINRKLHF
jgi:hypothetical protein